VIHAAASLVALDAVLPEIFAGILLVLEPRCHQTQFLREPAAVVSQRSSGGLRYNRIAADQGYLFLRREVATMTGSH
jgi:hypothetical protein